ncbi:MAG: hypothetical protein SFX18_00525 [Pirellulales bacterium]|nr:hypothetical protein [Pirellulales bacterium]
MKNTPKKNLETSYKVYLFKYYHDGSWWHIELPATDLEDAQARINKLPHAQALGELKAKIPVGLGFLAKFWCWLANASRMLGLRN